MEVTVTDKDDGDDVETVDKLDVSNPTGVRPSTGFISSLVVRGYAGRGFLRYNYRLTCLNGYTGDRCTICNTGQCTECKSYYYICNYYVGITSKIRTLLSYYGPIPKCDNESQNKIVVVILKDISPAVKHVTRFYIIQCLVYCKQKLLGED